jgi:hypothetical protein
MNIKASTSVLQTATATIRFLFAYLLLLWSGLKNVIHQHGHKFRYSVDTGSVGAVLGGAVNCLALSLGLFKPLPCYRVYDVKDAQLVRPRSLFEVGVDLLDENRFGLKRRRYCQQPGGICVALHACVYMCPGACVELSRGDAKNLPECWQHIARSN